jgi:basic membrane protein A
MRHSLHTHSAKKYVAGLVGAIGLLVIMATILLLGAAEGSAAQAEPFNVGLVFDNPDGADDLSFNWMAHQGLLRAENDLGVTGTVYTPTSGADYGPLLQQCVDDGNQVCIAVGFGMAGAI